MRLRHWTHPCKDIEYDPFSGRSKTIKLNAPRNEHADCFGYAASEKRFLGQEEHFAIFKNSKGIIFCAGQQCWELNHSTIKISHSRPYPFLSRFIIQAPNRKDYSFTYSHIGRLLYMFIDPTYDKIDQHEDFFLEFIAEHALSSAWQQHAHDTWAITDIHP